MNSYKSKYIFIFLRFISSLCEQTLFFSIPLLLYTHFNKDPKIIALAHSLIQFSQLLGLPISGFFISKILSSKLFFLCDLFRGTLCILIYFFINNNIVYFFIFLFGFISAISFVNIESSLPKILSNYSSNRKQSIMQIIIQSPAIIGPSLASFLLYFNLLNFFLIIFSVIFIHNGLISLSKKLFSFLILKNNHKNSFKFKEIYEVFKIMVSTKKIIYLTFSTFILNFIGSVSLILSPHIFNDYNQKTTFYSITMMLSAVLSIFSMLISINKKFFKYISVVKIGFISSLLILIFFGILTFSKNIFLFSVGFIFYHATIPFFVIFMRTERVKLIPKHIFAQSIGVMIFLYSLSNPLSGLFVTGFIVKYSSYSLLFFCFILTFLVVFGFFLTFNIFNSKK